MAVKVIESLGLIYLLNVYHLFQASPYAAMLAAQDVAARCKEIGITALHIKLRATGGNRFVCFLGYIKLLFCSMVFAVWIFAF